MLSCAGANASMVSTSITDRQLIAIIGCDLEYSRRSSPSSILADAGAFRTRNAGRLVLAVGRPYPTPGRYWHVRTKAMPALLNIDGLKLKAS